MKKNLVILFVFIFSAFLGYSQENKKSDLEKDNIKGKVKYIEESTYYPKGLFYNGKEMDIHREYKITKFNRDGNIEYEIIRGFHDYHRRIIPLKTIIYKYDSKGQKQECSQIDNKLSIVDKYYYDTKGNLIEKTYYDVDKEKSGKIRYKYDSKNNPVEVTRSWGGDSIDAMQISVFNNKGKVIKESYAFGRLNDKNYYYEDVKNNEENHDEYKYDSRGNKICYIGYGMNKIIARSDYKYDKYDNLIEKAHYGTKDSLPGITSIDYKYDKKSNWIWKKLNVVNYPNDNRIVERRIVYYGDKDENNYPLWDNPNYKAEEIETENMKVKF